MAVRDQSQWYVADSLHQAGAAGKFRAGVAVWNLVPPLELPEGDWALTLRTCWVEPAYLKTDASWCNPQGRVANPVTKWRSVRQEETSDVTDVARELAQANNRIVRVYGPERHCSTWTQTSPVSVGLRADGSGIFGSLVQTISMSASDPCCQM